MAREPLNRGRGLNTKKKSVKKTGGIKKKASTTTKRASTNAVGSSVGRTKTKKKVATGKTKSVKMVPLNELHDLGFSADYCSLVKSGFPYKTSPEEFLPYNASLNLRGAYK